VVLILVTSLEWILVEVSILVEVWILVKSLEGILEGEKGDGEGHLWER
jgi:hypothetical protein